MAWNGSGNSAHPQQPARRSSKPKVGHGIIAGLVTVVAALGVWSVFFDKTETVEKEDKGDSSGLIQEVAPSVPPSAATEEKKAEEKGEETKAAEDNGERIAKPKPRMQIYGARERMEERMKNGERPLFRHASESFLAMYAVPGVPVPPVPVTKQLEADFLTALTDPIKITDEDSEDEAQMKEMVAGMKDEVKDYIKAGGTLQGFFDELDKRQQSEVNYRNEAQRMVMESLNQGDNDETYALWKKFNSHLREKGIKELSIHPKLRSCLENDQQNESNN